MYFYRKAFRSIEQASDIDFIVLLELAQSMIDNTSVYNLVEFESKEDLFCSHQECIFHQGGSNSEKVKKLNMKDFVAKW